MNNNELSMALREVISSLHKVLRKQVSLVSDYSMTEIDTIGHLARNSSLLPSELASLTKVKTQSMSQILKKMEDQKIIKRTPCREDKRKVHISLTGEGKQMVKKIRNNKDEWVKNNIEGRLKEIEKQKLIEALPVLRRLAEIDD